MTVNLFDADVAMQSRPCGNCKYSCFSFVMQIIRGILLGLALMMYGQEEGSDGLTESMIRDQDPILRYSFLQSI